MARTPAVLSLLLALFVAGCAEKPASYQGAGGETKRLSSLRYVRSFPSNSPGGVLFHDTRRAYPGVNLYTATLDRETKLLDMDGNVLHTLVDKRVESEGLWEEGLWEFVELYPGGDFLVVNERVELMRIDWDSQVLWEVRLPFHHDVDVAENGDIYGVINDLQDVPALLPEPAIYNTIVIVSPDGEVKRRIELAAVFAKSPELAAAIQKEQFDWREQDDPMHVNTLEILKRDVTFGDKTLFKKGCVLFCMRNLDLIGVLDLQREEVVWHWGMDKLDRPHNPTLLDNNRLLIFDNGCRRGYAQVIELDPWTEEVTVVLDGNSKNTPMFFTKTMGSVQRLPNGNTLVVSSEEGHAFEVTPDGELVWDFRSYPLACKPTQSNRPYKMPRILEADMPDRLRELWRKSQEESRKSQEESQ